MTAKKKVVKKKSTVTPIRVTTKDLLARLENTRLYAPCNWITSKNN